MARSVDEAFPHLTEWVTTHGWIEIGALPHEKSYLTVC